MHLTRLTSAGLILAALALKRTKPAVQTALRGTTIGQSARGIRGKLPVRTPEAAPARAAEVANCATQSSSGSGARSVHLFV
mmetsp:Transcript_73900/g.228332  ORF Transcript_73900/g.228332 Transcript_73900/m.228332 type:complete len:81 (-) Transcript_73900:486-728(-)